MIAPMTIRAAVLHEANRPLAVEQIELDPPGADEVLVRVVAAGICHTDVHLADGHLGQGRWPIVLGHEGAGVVEAVGENIHHVAPGDHVAFCFVAPCGTCGACRRGRPNLCETASANAWAGVLPGGARRLRFPGGADIQHFNGISCFAEHCVVPAASAVALPSAFPLWQASLIGCGVVTGVGAVRNAAQVRIGDSVCVIGCGGVGLQAVAAARLAGAATVVAIDRDERKLALAKHRGATHTIDASAQDSVAAVFSAVPGGVDHAIEVVGAPETIRQAFAMLRPGGTAVVVGIAPQGVDVSIPALDFLSEKTLRGCYYGTMNAAQEMPALIAMAADGRLDVGDVVSHVVDLDGINDAFDRLRRGEGIRSLLVLDREAAGYPDGAAPAA
ncbi:MAG: S-(hydroxymethyl)glutathione dehydrogenase / alcohol dehydrogenase [Gaiellales bacterium]|jgi:Zn-dependent alcohol dehydrogenase|nr:S-(hydroxymethyl)glutathione dehydrogenase / alcohol dehydrogenase [Gaiellales bacterium]